VPSSAARTGAASVHRNQSSYLRAWTQALARVRQRRSVLLGYHGVAESRRREDLSMLLVSPDRFRIQLELLTAAGFHFVTLAEMARRAADGPPPPGLAAITFDDGMRNNYNVALPILQEYEIPASVYVTIGFMDGFSPWIGAGGDGAMMGRSELRELADAGWEIGAHTMTHPDMSALDYEACRREIEDSRDTLEEIVEGASVETFAYPFGRYGPAALAAVRDAGLLAAVTTGSGSWTRYEMTRAMVGSADPLAILLLKLTDRYEPLLASTPMQAVRRASKQVRQQISGPQRQTF
jgi:peptidoglycan/xylan/chitin deacetylase (PgdA/CDA1 family)